MNVQKLLMKLKIIICKVVIYFMSLCTELSYHHTVIYAYRFPSVFTFILLKTQRYKTVPISTP